MASDGIKRRKGTTAIQRLRQDYLRLQKDPIPYVTAQPSHQNILEWFVFIAHYVVRGPENTPYEGGIYHGKLQFPTEFPFKPPSIYMITPNGRFKCNIRLCLSISDYHPDTWNPAWSVSTILTGLLSFMLEKNPTMGSIETSDYDKRLLAQRSGAFNLKSKTFCDLFPEIVSEIKEKQKSEQNQDSLRSVSGKVTELSNSLRSAGFRAGNENGTFFGNTVTNVVIIICFVAFIYTVRYVLTAISASDNDNSL
ncbi:ubiquitin-conjugating enzyme E2 J2-like protein [Leptotrombidium deliense]|uniref:Ubiquitin-conjugating enzyme E2 J2 n=1 Tax=Leptotrombidium deliense TaxID=299467 RepID=A0A443S8F3_9ACAR|nr:ubiquitin-conjugating enzyme E2 J2-like protein [Leptotrombidium deliense]